MANNLLRPEDILADGVDSTFINGKTIRKGTIAAFLANVDFLKTKILRSNEDEKQLV